MSEKELDDLRIEFIEQLQILYLVKKKLPAKVYMNTSWEFARLIARDPRFITEDFTIRPELQDSLTDFMLVTCRMGEEEVTRLTSLKVNLFSTVNCFLNGKLSTDNLSLFKSAWRHAVRAGGDAISSLNDRFKKED